MQKVCGDRYNQFGTAGNASKIKSVSLDDFAAKYAKGVYAAPVRIAVGV
jgi:fructose-bisphosphate aldolase class II